MDQQEVLRLPFDSQRHKDTFPHYLEVIILEDGTVQYAVPSHNENLVQIIRERECCSRDDISNMCPPEYYADFGLWLALKAKALSVWTNFYIGTPSSVQLETLKTLQAEGIYEGSLKPFSLN